MLETLDIKEVVKNNPNIDEQRLDDGLDALRKLEESGMSVDSSYNLELPFSRKVIRPANPLSQVRSPRTR